MLWAKNVFVCTSIFSCWLPFRWHYWLILGWWQSTHPHCCPHIILALHVNNFTVSRQQCQTYKQEALSSRNGWPQKSRNYLRNAHGWVQGIFHLKTRLYWRSLRLHCRQSRSDNTWVSRRCFSHCVWKSLYTAKQSYESNFASFTSSLKTPMSSLLPKTDPHSSHVQHITFTLYRSLKDHVYAL